MPNNFNIPILFIIFNRPDTTIKVFNEIRKLKPSKLYVVADGPRTGKDGEKEKCEEVRKIIDSLDWECEVFKKYSNLNLGCKIAVSSGITWFFENVEEGIILEDDCVPDQSFFSFCKKLLEHYRYDQRIGMISGTGHGYGNTGNPDSYYYSRFSHIWGWASWRRVWQNYDVNMKTFPDFKKQQIIKNIWDIKKTQKYWLNIFQRVYDNKIDTWDYQFVYSNWINNYLSIIPNINLISNIGFNRADATHTKSKHRFANMSVSKIDEIIHPIFLVQNLKADKSFCKNFSLIRRILDKFNT